MQKKSWVEISLENWNVFVTDEFVWNPCTLKEMVQFVHDVYPVFAVIVSTFVHMLCGSIDDTMPSFNLFCVQVVVLSNYRVISWKYIIKCMKNSKWSQKGLKFQYVALNVACWMQKKSWVEISLEKWNAFETDESSSETLVLWKRWSSLYTKCIQFLP